MRVATYVCVYVICIYKCIKCIYLSVCVCVCVWCMYVRMCVYIFAHWVGVGSTGKCTNQRHTLCGSSFNFWTRNLNENDWSTQVEAERARWAFPVGKIRQRVFVVPSMFLEWPVQFLILFLHRFLLWKGVQNTIISPFPQRAAVLL